MRLNKKIVLPVALGLLLALVVGVAVVSAQTGTPPATSTQAGTPAHPDAGTQAAFLRELGVTARWSVFDAAAQALKLTPTQLFEQLHSGKTVAQIAQAQGVELQTVKDAAQAAAKTAREDALRQAIATGEQNGKITQDQANWLLQGLNNGWLTKPLLGQGRVAPRVLNRKPAAKPTAAATPVAPATAQP